MEENIEVKIIVRGGVVQEVLASKKISLQIIDLDNEPELATLTEKLSKKLKTVY